MVAGRFAVVGRELLLTVGREAADVGREAADVGRDVVEVGRTLLVVEGRPTEAPAVLEPLLLGVR